MFGIKKPHDDPTPRKEPKFDIPEGASKKKQPPRPTPYKWPGESPQGRGLFNRVDDTRPARVRRSRFMD